VKTNGIALGQHIQIGMDDKHFPLGFALPLFEFEQVSSKSGIA